MKNLIIERVIKISVYLTAEQWQLYTEAEPVGARVTAQELNKTLCDYVNRGETRAEVTRFMHSLMRHSSMYGADDTEPHAVLNAMLDEIFGEEE